MLTGFHWNPWQLMSSVLLVLPRNPILFNLIHSFYPSLLEDIFECQIFLTWPPAPLWQPWMCVPGPPYNKELAVQLQGVQLVNSFQLWAPPGNISAFQARPHSFQVSPCQWLKMAEVQGPGHFGQSGTVWLFFFAPGLCFELATNFSISSLSEVLLSRFCFLHPFSSQVFKPTVSFILNRKIICHVHKYLKLASIFFGS